VLYSPTAKAGSPFTLPGEAWWNLRFGGALGLLLVLGFAAGGIWTVLLERGRFGALAASVLAGYSYILFTRPLRPMLLTTATEMVTAVFVYVAGTARLDPTRLRRVLEPS